ncbi:MAG: hypothetical protein HY778_02635 [Betaproteobacteria bacterium]|nr:hypothetical protein [Betaproteobacteria bacterium]
MTILKTSLALAFAAAFSAPALAQVGTPPADMTALHAQHQADYAALRAQHQANAPLTDAERQARYDQMANATTQAERQALMDQYRATAPATGTATATTGTQAAMSRGLQRPTGMQPRGRVR